MIRLIRATENRLSDFNVLSFRSSFLKLTNSIKLDKKMVQTLSVEELRKRSAQAQELIEKLQNQIQQIKKQTTPESMSEKVKMLQRENEQLRNEVEQLKKELENAEHKPSEPVSSAPKPEAKKSEAKQKPAKQTEAKPKQEPKKAAAPVDEKVDFSKLDLRVGKIVKVEKHPDADSLYVEQIDLGEGKLRNVCSGLVKHIPLEGMQDKMVLVLCNLKPSKLRGVLSEAMVMCASTPEKVELLVPPPGAQIGDKITVEGFIGEPAPEINPKNNIFGLVQGDLKTDDNLNATYQGKLWQIAGKGPVTTSTLKNVPIK
ncbi:aminoacyl tRNA synthase complex-interacting multifunctional 1 [Brachionus plicatilis]|uniref:Aminoacyl tRNA synthase complex-interacting multifunctional 1 n=1 Tax=Brachionus plicatilis TaxID=10195 RepID=A0A3M7Q9C1_BRAPC|nr:aminoacyl tRNA synthase complex-interacting multifunctional 1 [Brachionus plicatilis]